ncbi:MAG: TlpA family protein disulfide reductase [Alphaproteobacteria bacterium]|nr:TlpA family protein disulfide reductase [Alphaproteobacteria bacterium]
MKNKGLLLLLALLAGSGGLYFYQQGERKVLGAEKSQSNGSTLAAFIRHPTPKDIPAFNFADGAGATRNLSQWKGKVVLLNLWATWCAPCRKEMPELSKLQKLMGSADFEVVALSEDLKGVEASSAFLKEAGAENLALYVDPKSVALAALQSPGLPTTLLIGRDGKEIGRLLGPADWAAPVVQEMIKTALAVK